MTEPTYTIVTPPPNTSAVRVPPLKTINIPVHESVVDAMEPPLGVGLDQTSVEDLVQEIVLSLPKVAAVLGDITKSDVTDTNGYYTYTVRYLTIGSTND
jgi:hypothetical protein